MASRFVSRVAVLVAPIFGLLACGSFSLESSLKDSATGDGQEPTQEDARGGSAPGPVGSTAGSGYSDAGASLYKGSPLCGESSAAATAPCVPGEAPVLSTTCQPEQGDGGEEAGPRRSYGDGGTGGLACNVVAHGNGEQGPACGWAGPGGDGAECLRSSDCAAGFECVHSPGRCRRYCCSLRCDDSNAFCDIQPTTASADVRVPVCTAVRTCKLLGSGCDQGQTCAVVTADGTTSCVAVGPGRAGESCERDHCADGHACLGQPGSRRCYRLCQVNDPSTCGGGQQCRGTAPLFKDMNVGVCE